MRLLDTIQSIQSYANTTGILPVHRLAERVLDPRVHGVEHEVLICLGGHFQSARLAAWQVKCDMQVWPYCQILSSCTDVK